MSDWGAIIDRLEVHWRTAYPDAPAGEQGWERGVRPVSELLDAEIPHGMAHDPSETTEEIEVGAQRLVAFSVQIDSVTRGETQELAIARLDAFTAAVRGDPTLGGLVDKVIVSSRGVVEFSGQTQRAAVAIIQTEKTV